MSRDCCGKSGRSLAESCDFGCKNDLEKKAFCGECVEKRFESTSEGKLICPDCSED